MLGIQNILSREELVSLLAVLESGKYIQLVPEGEIPDSNDKCYLLGPRSFTDLKAWIEQKSEYSQFECPLCSEYVLFKGFNCGHERCPNTVHKLCIAGYFASVGNNRNYKCPSCQNPVDIENMEALAAYIQVLRHPNDAHKVIEDLKKGNDSHNVKDSESDSDEDD